MNRRSAYSSVRIAYDERSACRLHLWGGVFEVTIRDDKPEIRLVREDKSAGEVLAVE